LKTLMPLKSNPNAHSLKLSQRLPNPREPKDNLREPTDRRCCTMTQPTHARIGLVRLGDSDFVPANPEDDLRGKAVHDLQGQRIGAVEELYIDGHEREVRFVEVGVGGILGIGEKHFLVPVEAITKVAEDRVTIEPGRTEWVTGPAPFDTRVAPPPAKDRKSDEHASLPFVDAGGTADRPGGIRSSFPYGRHPY
jgi:sporulation protein YlmC with PRC-barrel domain